MHNSANKLLRWKIIAVEFENYRHSSRPAPITQIYKRFIYPKFFISKSTLNTILATPIDKELKALGYTPEQINKHVSKYLDVNTTAVESGPVYVPADNPYMQTKHNQIF